MAAETRAIRVPLPRTSARFLHPPVGTDAEPHKTSLYGRICENSRFGGPEGNMLYFLKNPKK
jgi:hypothetical protein